jgi:hypothetical protein
MAPTAEDEANLLDQSVSPTTRSSSSRNRNKVGLTAIAVIVAFVAFTLVNNFVNVRMPDVPQKTKEQRSDMKAEQFSSACLVIMDDNHWLVEFLAYHYFTLNLREIIVTKDPRSRTSPESVLDRWKDRINITVWNDTNVMAGKQHTVTETHLRRQNKFYNLCQRELHARNHSWTITLDTDERVFINPQVSQPGNQLYRGPRAMPNISEPGSILNFLVQEKERNNGTVCLQMARTQIGSWNDTCNYDTAVKLPNNFHADDFLTLRFCNEMRDIVGAKPVVDLSGVNSSSLIAAAKDGHTHWTIPQVCPHPRIPIWWNSKNTLLRVYHYYGTKEQYFFRQDPRLVMEGNDNRTGPRTAAWYGGLAEKIWRPAVDLRGWLPGFIDFVGKEEAHFLLRDSGKTCIPHCH